ncbi:1-acyl-sn-glycerol-3-phosphate acyltransferase [Myxococcota bacterium]|nr:1-acyl-sn-glycerol-3-phosphate acyltransferase [Myxococcota bacterium]
MLDLQRLKQTKLSGQPLLQRIVAQALDLNYRLPKKTEIIVEGIEHVPADRGVFFAMNHTDRYNYWPFQYTLRYRFGRGFTATWVKGKYYEHPLMARFMTWANNIPIPSRGYVLSAEFRAITQRAPNQAEYRALRGLIDGASGVDLSPIEGFLRRRPEFKAEFDALFDQMMGEVIRLCREGLARGNHILVFPQGTRSRRLSRGHTGLAQITQHLGVDIIPVGCSGSDRVYPGASPVAKAGRITYRIGAPLAVDGPALRPHRILEPFTPFSAAAGRAHGEVFEAITELVMAQINELVEPEYQFSADLRSDGVEGVKRFL